jgi:hypothetical protein
MSTKAKTSSSVSDMAELSRYAGMFDGMKKDLDQNAFTLPEIAARIGMCPSQAARKAAEKVASGEWEQVWKKSGKNFARAYRPKS